MLHGFSLSLFIDSEQFTDCIFSPLLTASMQPSPCTLCSVHTLCSSESKQNKLRWNFSDFWCVHWHVRDSHSFFIKTVFFVLYFLFIYLFLWILYKSVVLVWFGCSCFLFSDLMKKAQLTPESSLWSFCTFQWSQTHTQVHN